MWNERSPPKLAEEETRPAVRVTTLPPRADAVVVLPTLNEELGLDRTLSELPFDRFGDPSCRVEVVIIDGGSTDRTLEVAKKWGIPVLHQVSKGKGAAVLEAVEWVRRREIPYVIVLDADATYPPSAILPALNLLREGVDLVTGVRHPVGGPPRSLRDLVHRIGNVALSYAASVLGRRPILDICSGFWGVSTRRFAELGIGAAEFAIEAELVMKALSAGLDFAQIPIEYRDRLGTAKIHAARDGGEILLSIVRFAPGRRGPAPPYRVPGVPSRQLLSIALIAELRHAILESPLKDLPMANRLGLLLYRSLPDANVRVRLSVAEPPETDASRADSRASTIFVALPAPGGMAGTPPFTVAIRPRENEFTVRLAPAATRHRTRASGTRPRRSVPGHPLGRYRAILGAVTTRMDFDPIAQQAAILQANGFTVLRRAGRGEVVP